MFIKIYKTTIKSSKLKFWAFSVLMLLFSFSIQKLFPQQKPINQYRVSDSFFENRVSIVFTGDIMNHMSQIKSANIPGTDNYDYSHTFKYISPILKSYDFAVGNLETTFGGKPYSGFPAFSAPDTLAWFLKDAGFNVLVTANNHTSDKGNKGIKGTFNALNRNGFIHTGSFPSEKEKNSNNPAMLEKNGLKIALLNYTYGTNNNSEKLLINKIDTSILMKDIKSAKEKMADAIIVFFHWGQEYSRTPNLQQTKIAELCFSNGVNVVIGSHPHVIQKVITKQHTKIPDKTLNLCAFSLGNLLSNQRWRYSDGGLIIGFDLVKNNKTNLVEIQNIKTEPIWVYPHFEGNRKYYDLIPAEPYEQEKLDIKLNNNDREKIRTFIDDTRKLINGK